MVVALLAILTGVLAACVNSIAPNVPQMDFKQYGIQRLNVERIKIVNDYKPPLREPNVEHNFVTPPYVAAQQWAQNRFQAVGNIGQATVRVLDAKVIHQNMPVRNGVEGMFYNDQGEKLEARLVVRVEVESPQYENIPYAEAEVVRNMTLPENITLAERDRAYQQLTTDMISELNRVMTQSIQRNMMAVLQP